MERSVLNKGRVELIDRMGNDYSVLRAARVSTGAEISKGEVKDKGLIRYLYRNNHISPFSFVSFQFYFKMPIFVARQMMRHRTFDINEASARYKEFEWDVFRPEEWRQQSTKNKQGSEDVFSDSFSTALNISLDDTYDMAERFYKKTLENNVTREQARIVMPVGQYTEFFAHVNLRNLFHFLSLRLDEHAQYEIRVYAEAVLKILENLDDLKWSVEAFKEYNELESLKVKCINKKDLAGFKEHLENYLQGEENVRDSNR